MHCTSTSLTSSILLPPQAQSLPLLSNYMARKPVLLSFLGSRSPAAANVSHSTPEDVINLMDNSTKIVDAGPNIPKRM